MDTRTAVSQSWSKLKGISRRHMESDRAMLRELRNEIVRTAYLSGQQKQVGGKLQKLVYSPIAHRMQPLGKVITNGIAFYGWDKKTVMKFLDKKLS